MSTNDTSGDNNTLSNSKRPKRAKNIDIVDEFGRTRLHSEVIRNNIEKVQILLERGATVNILDKSGYSPLHWAVRHNRLNIIKLLIAYGADVNIQNNIKIKNMLTGPPLQTAIDFKHKDLVRYLLANGANPNEACNRGCNVFLFAVMSRKQFLENDGYIEILRSFLDHGANCTTSPNVFRMAISYGNEKAVRLLVERGVDLSALKEKSGEMLYDAAFNTDQGILKFLVKSRQLNVNDMHEGKSALYICACLGKTSSAKCLMKHGADADVQNSPYEETALYAAIWHFRTEMVRLLLERQVNVNIRNTRNQYVLEVALHVWRPEITYEVLRHLALIKEQQRFVDSANYQLIRANVGLEFLFEDYKRELKLMKQTYLLEDVTVFDVIKNTNNAVYVKNAELVSQFHKVCNKFNFPVYYDLVAKFFFKELEKHEVKVAFVKRVLSSFSNIKEDLLINVFDGVFKYLKKRDLQNLKQV